MKAEIFALISRIKEERGTSVVLVSHEMEDVAKYSDRVLLLADGKICLQGTPREVFSQVEKVRELGADVPAVTEFIYELGKKGLRLEPEVKIPDAADVITAAVNGGESA